VTVAEIVVSAIIVGCWLWLLWCWVTNGRPYLNDKERKP
jgi:hypothetical protein